MAEYYQYNINELDYDNSCDSSISSEDSDLNELYMFESNKNNEYDENDENNKNDENDDKNKQIYTGGNIINSFKDSFNDYYYKILSLKNIRYLIFS